MPPRTGKKELGKKRVNRSRETSIDAHLMAPGSICMGKSHWGFSHEPDRQRRAFAFKGCMEGSEKKRCDRACGGARTCPLSSPSPTTPRRKDKRCQAGRDSITYTHRKSSAKPRASTSAADSPKVIVCRSALAPLAAASLNTLPPVRLCDLFRLRRRLGVLVIADPDEAREPERDAAVAAET